MISMEGQWASKFCYPGSQKLKNIFPALNDVLLIAGVLAAGSIEVLEECGEMVVRFRSGVLVSCLVYLWFRVVVDRVLDWLGFHYGQSNTLREEK